MVAKRKPVAPPVAGIAWTDEEWQRLAQAWARDEALHPQATEVERWKSLVPQLFAPDRQRPLPKARLQDRAKPLFERLPLARASLRSALTSAIGVGSPAAPVAGALTEDSPTPPPAPQETAGASPQPGTALSASEDAATPPLSAAEEVGEGTSEQVFHSEPLAEAPAVDARLLSPALSSDEAAKRRRIFWTYDERLSFVRVYALLEHEHPRMPMSVRVDKAQKHLVATGELRAERRRTANPTVMLQSAELKPMLEQARIDLLKELQAQQTQAPVDALPPAGSAVMPAQGDSKDSTFEAARAGAAHEGAPKIVPGVAPGVGSSLPATPQGVPPVAQLSGMELLALAAGAFLSEALASPRVQQALATSLAPLMRQAVIDVLNGPSLQEQAAPAASPTLAAEASLVGVPPPPVVAPVVAPGGPPLPVRPPRKKLLVVGLLGSQQKEIMAGFADTFELRFLTQDDSSSRMEQHARSCDITIGMVGYMSHSAEKHLKKAAPNYRRCNGTVGELRRILQGLAH